MLPAAHRLTDASSYRRVLRRGRRASSRTLVVSLLPGPGPGPGAAADVGTSETLVVGPAQAPRAGLVVSKAVGDAVTRNRVKRRLRHLARPRLATLPSGSDMVLRALPLAASASSEELARDLDACLSKVLR